MARTQRRRGAGGKNIRPPTKRAQSGNGPKTDVPDADAERIVSGKATSETGEGTSEKEWHRKILDLLVAITATEKEFEEFGAEWEALEQWEKAAGNRIFDTLLVTTNFNPKVPLTSAKVGSLAGHACAAWTVLREGIENETLHALLTSKKKMERTMGVEMKRLLRHMQKQSRSALVQIHKCLRIAIQQDLSEQRLFFNAFNNALRKGTITKAGEFAGMDTSTSIYCTLLSYGDMRLRKLAHSVADLHRILCASLGSRVMGDQKRLEKICERIGLHFRKPGRPKIKAMKITDTPPA